MTTTIYHDYNFNYNCWQKKSCTKWDVQNPLNHLNDHDLSDQVVKIAVKMACGVHGAFGLETQWAENGHADVFSMDFGLDAYNIYIYTNMYMHGDMALDNIYVWLFVNIHCII